MPPFVAYNATAVKRVLAPDLNDGPNQPGVVLHCVKRSAGNYTMANDQTKVTRIHEDKNPRRIHFIAEWIDKRGLKQADVVRALGVDKATVSRWCSGYVPENKNLGPLVKFLQLEAPSDLFRHPDDTWMSRFFEGRTREELEHIRRSLEVTFPRGNGTTG
jgi:transcriptional regulator with XRE-family HTH domain